MLEEMTLNEFKEYVKKNDKNLIYAGDLKQSDFKEKFVICCKECGSLNVEFTIEGGSMGGENDFKCINCGNALTWYQ